MYPLTEGLTADRFRSLVSRVLPAVRLWPEPLPRERRQARQLLSRDRLWWRFIGRNHRSSFSRPGTAWCLMNFAVAAWVDAATGGVATALRTSLRCASDRDGLMGRFLELLPFELTGAQQRVLAEIELDLDRPEPMARLVQGDVGSGKTVVAVAALLKAIQAGWQGAMMAPTEVLAEQHYRSLCTWMPPLHVTVELLTGSTPQKQRRRILADVASGPVRSWWGPTRCWKTPLVLSGWVSSWL